MSLLFVLYVMFIILVLGNGRVDYGQKASGGKSETRLV